MGIASSAQRLENLVRLFGCVQAYDEMSGLFTLSPDRIGFGFVLNTLSGVSNQVHDRIKMLLDLAFPTGTILQFSLYASPDIEDSLHAYKVMRHRKCDDPLIQKLVDERATYLRDLTGTPLRINGGSRLRSLRAMITVALPHGPSAPNVETILKTRELIDATESALRGMNIRFAPLTPQRYLRFMGPIINHGPDASWRLSHETSYDDTQFIAAQVLESNNHIAFGRRDITFGDGTKARVLSIKRYPEWVWTGMATRFIGDLMTGNKAMQDRVLFTFNLMYPDHESVHGQIERDKAWTTRQVEGPLARYIPAWGERKRSLDIASEASSEGDRFVRGYLGMVVFGSNDSEVTKASVALRGQMREQGFHVMEDAYFLAPLFSQLLPFAAAADMQQAMMRYRTMPTRHAVPLLPIFGSWGGTGTPLLTLITRDGQLMPVSPNDSEGNMNVVVAAKSGAGKSFLSNELVTNYLSIGGRAWIIDKGYSYKHLSHLLGGTFIEFNEQDLSLNPFAMVKSWQEESDIVASVLEVMSAPKEDLNNFQVTGLKRVAEEIWTEKGKAATVRDVANRLLEAEDSRLQDIGHQLHPFAQGEYSRYFMGANNVDLSNRLVVLELQNLSGRQHLQRVVLLLLMYQIQSAMDSLPRDLPKLLLVDEAFGLLASNETKNFLTTWYRQLRKFGATAMICTQSVSDLYEGDGAQAIVANSAHTWLLAQEPESIAMVKREGQLALSEAAFNMLESVYTIPGAMSEIMIRSSYGIGIGRLVVSDFCKLLYSTRAQDVEAIKAYRQQGLPLQEAILAVLRDRTKKN